MSSSLFEEKANNFHIGNLEVELRSSSNTKKVKNENEKKYGKWLLSWE